MHFSYIVVVCRQLFTVRVCGSTHCPECSIGYVMWPRMRKCRVRTAMGALIPSHVAQHQWSVASTATRTLLFAI